MSEPIRWIVFEPVDDLLHPDVLRGGVAPKWVKNQTRLLHDDTYFSLTPNRRSILHGVMMMYALARGRLPLDTLQISSRLGLRVRQEDLSILAAAGYFAVSDAPAAIPASSLQASRKHDASLEQSRTEVLNPTATEEDPPEEPHSTRSTRPVASSAPARVAPAQPAAAAGNDLATMLDTCDVSGPLRVAAFGDPLRAQAWAAKTISDATSNRGGFFRRGFESGTWPAAVASGAPRSNVVPADPRLAIETAIRNGAICDEIDLAVELRAGTNRDLTDDDRAHLLELLRTAA